MDGFVTGAAPRGILGLASTSSSSAPSPPSAAAPGTPPRRAIIAARGASPGRHDSVAAEAAAQAVRDDMRSLHDAVDAAERRACRAEARRVSSELETKAHRARAAATAAASRRTTLTVVRWWAGGVALGWSCGMLALPREVALLAVPPVAAVALLVGALSAYATLCAAPATRTRRSGTAAAASSAGTTVRVGGGRDEATENESARAYLEELREPPAPPAAPRMLEVEKGKEGTTVVDAAIGFLLGGAAEG
jgi:hypothetical protein